MPQNPVEQALFETLEEYLDAVRRAGDPSVDLQGYFRKIELLGKTLPPSTHPQLRHYLQSKSYRKAWHFLGGEDSKNAAGSCGK